MSVETLNALLKISLVAFMAGNLLDMFASLRAANDLETWRPVNAPSLRVDGMTVAGG